MASFLSPGPPDTKGVGCAWGAPRRDRRAIKGGGQQRSVTVSRGPLASQVKVVPSGGQAVLQAGSQEFESPRLHHPHNMKKPR
jgi:hypothetical protein